MFSQFRFRNGVRVFLEPHTHEEQLALAVGVSGGTIHDPPGKIGLAHWLEHLLFNSNEFRSASDIAYTLERKCGDIFDNAQTSATKIVLYSVILATHASRALEVYGEIIRSSTVDRREALREQKMVIDEHKNVDQDPRRYLVERMFAPRLFAGTRLERYWQENQKSVAQLTLEDVLTLKQQRFIPEEIFVCVAGGMDAPVLIQEIEKRFGSLPPSGMRFRNRSRPIPLQTPSIEPHPEECWGERLDKAYVVQGWRVPPAGHKDAVAMTVLWGILGLGMSSWVFQRIRGERGLGYDPSLFYTNFDGVGAACYALLGISSPKQSDEAHAILARMFHDVCAVDAATLNDTKNLLRAHHLESQKHILNRAEFAAERACGMRTLDSEEFLSALELIDTETISRVARKYFSPPPLCVHLLPGTRDSHSS